MEDTQPIRERSDSAPAEAATRQETPSLDIAPALAQALDSLVAGVYIVDASARVRHWGNPDGPAGNGRCGWEALDASEQRQLLELCAAVLGDATPRRLVLEQAKQQILLEPIRQGRSVVATLMILRDFTEHAFVDAAAHELRTPLTAIKGYAQIAQMRLESANHELLESANHELLERALRTIVEQADRISRLVGHLGDASRLHSGSLKLHREPTELVSLLRTGVAEAQKWAPRHTLRVTAPRRLHGVCDRERVSLVLTHLLENAVKYSPAGGPVDVALDSDKHYARITVRDSGIGVAQEQQPYIFEPWSGAYSATASVYGGFGLGLSLCRAIVEQHGGGMWVESGAAGGSLFGFRLPIGMMNDE